MGHQRLHNDDILNPKPGHVHFFKKVFPFCFSFSINMQQAENVGFALWLLFYVLLSCVVTVMKMLIKIVSL